MDIEYENGLPKGYVNKRKKVNIIYIVSIYVYCLFNIILKVSSPAISGNLAVICMNMEYIIENCGKLVASICRRMIQNKDTAEVIGMDEWDLIILPDNTDSFMYFTKGVIDGAFHKGRTCSYVTIERIQLP